MKQKHIMPNMKVELFNINFWPSQNVWGRRADRSLSLSKRPRKGVDGQRSGCQILREGWRHTFHRLTSEKYDSPVSFAKNTNSEPIWKSTRKVEFGKILAERIDMAVSSIVPKPAELLISDLSVNFSTASANSFKNLLELLQKERWVYKDKSWKLLRLWASLWPTYI